MAWDESNDRKQDDRDLLAALKYDLRSMRGSFEEHRAWLRDELREHKDELAQHFKDDKAVESRVARLERNWAFVLGGIFVIEAVMKFVVPLIFPSYKP